MSLPIDLVIKTHKDFVEPLTIVFRRKSRSSFDLKFQWAGETMPCCPFHVAYKIFRKLKYGRTWDQEILHLELIENRVSSFNFSERMHLDSTYHWNKTFPPPHDYHTYPISQLTHEDGKPVIYIATWNHIFAKSVFNPTDYVTVDYNIEWEH